MKRLLPIALVILASCNTAPKEKYDPANFLNDAQKKEILSGVVSYIFIAPPYTQMKDRFKPEHKHFYDSMSQRLFSLDRFFIDDHKREYYLVIRPGTKPDEKRAVGGFYDRGEDKQFKNFRERFVTPILKDSVARARGRFLFDQMVKGDLDRFLKMPSYAQWPNAASYYDSTKYEWVLNVSRSKQDTTKVDTIRIN